MFYEHKNSLFTHRLFSENLGAAIEEQGERLHQDVIRSKGLGMVESEYDGWILADATRMTIKIQHTKEHAS